jgi:hypothetical protein
MLHIVNVTVGDTGDGRGEGSGSERKLEQQVSSSSSWHGW